MRQTFLATENGWWVCGILTTFLTSHPTVFFAPLALGYLFLFHYPHIAFVRPCSRDLRWMHVSWHWLWKENQLVRYPSMLCYCQAVFTKEPLMEVEWLALTCTQILQRLPFVSQWSLKHTVIFVSLGALTMFSGDWRISPALCQTSCSWSESEATYWALHQVLLTTSVCCSVVKWACWRTLLVFCCRHVPPLYCCLLEMFVLVL